MSNVFAEVLGRFKESRQLLVYYKKYEDFNYIMDGYRYSGSHKSLLSTVFANREWDFL